MAEKKLIQPGATVGLKLTQAERKLVLDDLLCLDEQYERLVRNTPPGKPVMMTLNELDDFAGYIAAEANHCDSEKKQKQLDWVFGKIQDLLERYTDEEPPQTINLEDARKAQEISGQAVQVAEWAAQALVVAEQLGIKHKQLDHFALAPGQREVLLLAPGLTKKTKQKLGKHGSQFTVAEVAGLVMAVAESLPEGAPKQQVALLLVTKHLLDSLQEAIAGAATPRAAKRSKRKAKTRSSVLYQFKITLLDSDPSIWRRIQVRNCTLDKLHEHIQTAMGWTNSHLHQFEIRGGRYGDPELLDDFFDEFECTDSTETMLGDILPASGKRFALKYKYDFGGGWEHEVLFEGCPPAEKGRRYPVCLEGERACPPEDIGGVWGYQSFLAAIADPDHDQHQELLEWCGGSFAPDAFDPAKATRQMKKGLPDWRRM